ncbi:DUF6691 family protein [Asticcacaulis sp. EMRT-3]|uniref:DUF6691 family protein n=1 Tax=Asticcacaulis sp. EMRT-3 TaxID=3040349 RepID=UPI0024AF19C8|nr:DUF6691 family protein [Asticcacaulis sp. EMRT-3]MDI7775249.1 YeeE/YedE family protein [Asticcacaulis sp. EMRT-3]
MKLSSNLWALVFGLLLGGGLIVSGMTDTANVKGFLDFAGHWRPALALVMGGAVLVALPLFRLAAVRGRTMMGATPPQRIDARLLIGAGIFGIGWGLSGICPGPGLVWLGIDPLQAAPFIIAVLVGAGLADLLDARRALVSDTAPAPKTH